MLSFCCFVLPWVFIFFCSRLKVTIYLLKNIALLSECLRPWMCYEPCKLSFFYTLKNNNHDQELNLKFVSPRDRFFINEGLCSRVQLQTVTLWRLWNSVGSSFVVVWHSCTLTGSSQDVSKAFSFSKYLLCFFLTKHLQLQETEVTSYLGDGVCVLMVCLLLQ